MESLEPATATLEGQALVSLAGYGDQSISALTEMLKNPAPAV